MLPRMLKPHSANVFIIYSLPSVTLCSVSFHVLRVKMQTPMHCFCPVIVHKPIFGFCISRQVFAHARFFDILVSQFFGRNFWHELFLLATATFYTNNIFEEIFRAIFADSMFLSDKVFKEFLRNAIFAVGSPGIFNACHALFEDAPRF